MQFRPSALRDLAGAVFISLFAGPAIAQPSCAPMATLDGAAGLDAPVTDMIL